MSRSILPGIELCEKEEKKRKNHHNTGKKTHFHRLAIKQKLFLFLPQIFGSARKNKEENGNMRVETL
jgi:hypothetical protein